MVFTYGEHATTYDSVSVLTDPDMIKALRAYLRSHAFANESERERGCECERERACVRACV